MTDTIVLPPGICWHPNGEHPTHLVARFPNPAQAGVSISNYWLISGLNRTQLTQAIVELYLWLEREGAAAWPNWPHIDRRRVRRVQLLDNLPHGVSCYIMAVSKCKRPPNSPPVIRVTCYWQDYSKPKKPGGGYPQRNKHWQRPLGVGDGELWALVELAREHRAAMLAKHPRPPREQLYRRKRDRQP